MTGARERRRALANVGSTRQRVKGTQVRPARAADGDSHSQGDAANSENSALTSTSSVTGSTGSVTAGSAAGALGPATGAPTAEWVAGGGVASGATEGVELSGYGWYAEYVELSRAYPWRLAAYMAWAASPVVGRRPGTQWELAQAIGLKTDRTIRQWKEKDPQIEQVIAQLQAAPLWRHRRDLYEALVKAALGGDVPAIKLALEMTGDYVPRMKQTVDNTVKLVGYTADELAAAERELGEWERERGRINSQ